MLFFPDRLRIYNWKKLTPLAYLDYHTDTVNAVDFSDDLPEYGQLLAAGGKDARISVWSLYNEKRQAAQWQARWWRVFSTRWSYVERWVKWGYAAFATIPSFFKAQSGACLVPRRLSLDINLRAKGRWEGNHLSSFSFPWSLAVRHQSLAFRNRIALHRFRYLSEIRYVRVRYLHIDFHRIKRSRKQCDRCWSLI